MTVPTIDVLPDFPLRGDEPAVFAQKANDSVAAYPTMVTQMNAMGQFVEDAAALAVAAKDAAQLFSNAELWVSGQSYDLGDAVVSPVDLQTYRANTSTSGTTDPSLSDDWVRLGGIVNLASGVTGTLAVANGGTGATTSTGSGAVVLATSPTLVTPVLGTPSSGNLSSCTADGTNEVGFRHIPQNSNSAAYTLVLADAGKHIFHPSADTTARTFTIPANSAVTFPIGTAITFINQNGAGVVTIAITTDTMRLAGAGTTGSRTLAANGVATAVKVTSTEWMINGTGLT